MGEKVKVDVVARGHQRQRSRVTGASDTCQDLRRATHRSTSTYLKKSHAMISRVCILCVCYLYRNLAGGNTFLTIESVSFN